MRCALCRGWFAILGLILYAVSLIIRMPSRLFIHTVIFVTCHACMCVCLPGVCATEDELFLSLGRDVLDPRNHHHAHRIPAEEAYGDVPIMTPAGVSQCCAS